MTFKVGDKVVYPNHGVGVIEQVANKTFGDQIASFYCLRILSTDSTVMVPVGNTASVGLRKVLTKKEIARVLKVLRSPEVATYDDWKGRYQANSEKMRTGDILAVAEVLKSLTILRLIKRAEAAVKASRVPVRAIAEPTEPTAPGMLERIGFEYLGRFGGDEIYEWEPA